MRKFSISWQEKQKQKFGEPSIRISNIILSKSTGNIGKDAKAALNILISNFKALKYSDVINIQEIDKEGNPIGEPIKPMEDTSMVPTSK